MRRCGGKSKAFLQLKDFLELFVNRREFPGVWFRVSISSRYDLSCSKGRKTPFHPSFLPSFVTSFVLQDHGYFNPFMPVAAKTDNFCDNSLTKAICRKY